MKHAAVPMIESFKKDPQVRKIINQYSEVSTMKQGAALAFDWSIMFGAAFLCHSYFNPLTYMLALVVIASRQHALLVIMHEAAHLRVSKKIWLNDFIGDCLAAYPILISTDFYRKHHTAHHRHTNTQEDPDWVRKINLKEWQYPQSQRQIALSFGKTFLIGGYQWLALMWAISGPDWKKKGLYWGAVVAAVCYLGVFKEFLLYWMVPLLTVLPVIQRVRSTSEHFGLDRTHEFNGTRNVMIGLGEKFFLAPHNINYHLAHHMYPSVPFYNLKAFHESLNKFEAYRDLAHNSQSYLFGSKSVLSDLTACSKDVVKSDAA